MPTLFNTLLLNPKRVFLADGLGALLSAFLLGIVLVRFESSFGMPKNTLYILAILAGFFAAYSFACYFFVDKIWKPYLKAIAFANLLYCCLTLGLTLYFYTALTTLGVVYFFAEIGVIITLVIIEFKTAFNHST